MIFVQLQLKKINLRKVFRASKLWVGQIRLSYSFPDQKQVGTQAGNMVFSLTTDEQVKIHQLKTLLEEHLMKNVSMDPKICQEVKKAIADHEFLYKYLRGRKLNVNKAFETILKYVEIKCVTYPEFFPDQVPHYVRLAIDSELLKMMNKKDELGRFYFLVDSTKYDDSVLSTAESANVLRYVVEYLIGSPDFLDNGVVILNNAKGLQMKHAKNSSDQVNFYLTFWRGFPGKLKEVIYFNAPIFGKPIFSVVKPFIKSKVIDRIYVSSGLGELQKRVPLNILPKSLGGTLEDEGTFVPKKQLLAMVLGKNL